LRNSQANSPRADLVVQPVLQPVFHLRAVLIRLLPPSSSGSRWSTSESAKGCRPPFNFTPAEEGWGGPRSRAASALVGVTPDLEVPISEVFEGNESVLAVTDAVLRLQGEGWIIRELAYDPWRYQAEALRLHREHGIVVVEFPQSHSRMTVASEGLHAAVVEQALRSADRALEPSQQPHGLGLDKMTRHAQ
jgi:hypothetical protein